MNDLAWLPYHSKKSSRIPEAWMAAWWRALLESEVYLCFESEFDSLKSLAQKSTLRGKKSQPLRRHGIFLRRISTLQQEKCIEAADSFQTLALLHLHNLSFRFLLSLYSLQFSWSTKTLPLPTKPSIYRDFEHDLTLIWNKTAIRDGRVRRMEVVEEDSEEVMATAMVKTRIGSQLRRFINNKSRSLTMSIDLPSPPPLRLINLRYLNLFKLLFHPLRQRDQLPHLDLKSQLSFLILQTVQLLPLMPRDLLTLSSYHPL